MTNSPGNEIVCLLFLQNFLFQFHFSQRMHLRKECRKDDLFNEMLSEWGRGQLYHSSKVIVFFNVTYVSYILDLFYLCLFHWTLEWFCPYVLSICPYTTFTLQASHYEIQPLRDKSRRRIWSSTQSRSVHQCFLRIW